MGKIKYIDKVRQFFKKTPVVSIDSIKKLVTYKGYAYLMIKNMLDKGEIKRVTKGHYTVYDDPELAVFCFKPAYLGLQDALSIHNLWEQETNPVIITSKKIKQGVRNVFGANVLIRRILPKYLFGFDYIKQGDFYVPVSDIEKTAIDMVYYKEKIDKELLKELKKRIDAKKLKDYLKKYPAKIRKRVLSGLDNTDD